MGTFFKVLVIGVAIFLVILLVALGIGIGVGNIYNYIPAEIYGYITTVMLFLLSILLILGGYLFMNQPD